MKYSVNLVLALMVCCAGLRSQETVPCLFDEYTNKKSLEVVDRRIQAAIQKKLISWDVSHSTDTTRTIPIVVHVIHDGGSENISDAQIASQIQILNEDYGKLPGTNGDGSGVDTKVRFCLAGTDPDGHCTNGIVRVKSPLTNHQSYQRALLKQLSFWDNNRYLNIYIVKSINGNVGGYSSYPGGPPDEDGVVVRHNLFGNVGTAAKGYGRTTTHELGHWFGLYHTFNNGCGIDPCLDGDYVCDTPPQAAPSFTCVTMNTCSNDVPDVNDLKENYLNYTPGSCQNMFTNGQMLRINATLDSIRTYIWSQPNLISTGCDSNYSRPSVCPVVADFISLTPELCQGNSANFIDRSLNNPTSWQWTFSGGTPSTSTQQNPTVSYTSTGTYAVKLVVSDSVSADSIEILKYVTVSIPGRGDSLPISENFDAGIYPPASLTINNVDDGVTWELDSLASVSGRYSIKINNLINTNYGSADELVLQWLDFTTATPGSGLFMSFWWAYAKSDPTYSDELLVLVSSDCGMTFDRVFYRTQNDLATGPTQTTPFIPDSTQWKRVFVLLNSYKNASYVQVKFVNVTDGGNNLYIDDIYVGDGTGLTSVQEPSAIGVDMSVYPNPSNEISIVEYTLERQATVNITVYAPFGQEIVSYMEGIKDQGLHRFLLSTADLVPGMYFVRVQAGESEHSMKFIVAE
ncbi:MAG: PKD domain-containing protein [Ignavibacteria bacterium]|nr:PKD domain-containing protein [Ignavibacteria bacterium]